MHQLRALLCRMVDLGGRIEEQLRAWPYRKVVRDVRIVLLAQALRFSLLFRMVDLGGHIVPRRQRRGGRWR